MSGLHLAEVGTFRNTATMVRGKLATLAKDPAQPKWMIEILTRIQLSYARIMAPWIEALAQFEPMRDSVDEEFRDTWERSLDDLQQEIGAYIQVLFAVAARRPSDPDDLRRGDIVRLVQHLVQIEQRTYRVVGFLQLATRSADARFIEVATDPLISYARAALLSMAAVALVEARALDRILSGADGSEDDRGHAARMRRARARRRRGVAFVAQVEVHTDDLELLRQYGFLTTSEKDDRSAVEGAIESFLLSSFLSRQDAGVPWRARWEAQKSRRATLKEALGSSPVAEPEGPPLQRLQKAQKQQKAQS